ncbi:MAG: protein-disulfide reductase DsbD family protein [Crocinitomicaceae bacterium]|nr:protein-disulfide reductase DsbD family protein [Crocinitomicaceae bacterium]
MKIFFKPFSGVILPLLALMVTFSSWGQLEFPDDKVSWKFTVEQDGEDATIVGTITMVEHWHIYAANLPEGTFTIPSEVVLKGSSDFKLVGGVTEPKPIFEHDEMADEDLYYHSHTIKLKQKIKVLTEDDFEINGTFSFQTCDDTHCLPPFDADFTVKVKGVKKEEGTDSANIEETFVKVDGDFAVDAEDVSYVKVDDQWFAVPEGNSAPFYKKYLTLGGSHEE